MVRRLRLCCILAQPRIAFQSVASSPWSSGPWSGPVSVQALCLAASACVADPHYSSIFPEPPETSLVSCLWGLMFLDSDQEGAIGYSDVCPVDSSSSPKGRSCLYGDVRLEWRRVVLDMFGR